MKFIIPKNYKFSSKILGMLDYQTATLDILCLVISIFISNLIFKNISTKIYFCISLTLPITLFSIIGFNQENIISVLKYLIKYFKNQKIYLYNK